ncbi:hemerythrin domain-containing protein [Actinokineospora sp.]|uniref:hemerythrin domain-containing protein n=1 Tax=Actinokineospora sp. TaxID=1872133 RepID=UPI003D6A966F
MTDDVIELILADHRLFEDLFRDLRDDTNGQAKVLAELSTRLVAHAEAEEAEVYPALRRLRKVDAEEVKHFAAGCGDLEHVRELAERTEDRIDE